MRSSDMAYRSVSVFCVLVFILQVTRAVTPPNIVLIVADDLGWNDVSFHGSKQIPTPNIDTLAYEGIILNNYYVSPICTPTRGALMTGRHPIHTGLQHSVIMGAEPYGLPLNETIMPQYLKKLGYRTRMVGKVGVIYGAQPYGLPLNETIMPQYLQRMGYRTHMVGKWHLGFFQKAYEPVNRGFETHYGYYQGCGDYFDHSYEATEWHLGFYTREHTPFYRGFESYYGHYLGCGDYFLHASEPEEGWFGYDFRRNASLDYSAIGQYSTELFNDEALKIIDKHSVAEPLFLYLPYQAVHSGNLPDGKYLQAPDKYLQRFPHIHNTQRKLYAGMVSALDDSVGNVVDALKKKGMYDNSIIVFTTDNGGPANGFDGNAANNAPLRGLKATMWEGGVRGVGFIHSPLLKSKSYVAEQMIHVCDWMPTLYKAAGGNPSDLNNSDGLDLWEMLSANGKSVRTEMLHNIDPTENKAAIRVGDYKLLVGGISMKHDGWYPPWQVDADSEKFHIDTMDKFNSRRSPNVLEYEQSNSLSLSNSISERYFGTPVRVHCGQKPANASTNCNPAKAACLYHIPTDPCEYNNIADQNKAIVIKLLDRLNAYNKTMVPPLNKPQDPAGNPKNNNGAWVPWM